MLAPARKPGSTTVHHGIPSEVASQGEWLGTLCDPYLQDKAINGPDDRILVASKKQVTCLRCLRMARRGKP